MFGGKIVHEEETGSHQGAVMPLIRHLEENYGRDTCNVLVCAEPTGQYTFLLACACKSARCRLWPGNPAEFKYSSGIQSGKNDKVDAKRIAIYARRFQDKVQWMNALPGILKDWSGLNRNIHGMSQIWQNIRDSQKPRKTICLHLCISARQTLAGFGG